MSIKRNEKDGQKTGKMWTGSGKAEKRQAEHRAACRPDTNKENFPVSSDRGPGNACFPVLSALHYYIWCFYIFYLYIWRK